MKKYEKIITKYTSKIITTFYKWENVTPAFYNNIYDVLLDFYIWKSGTFRENIWHWFDERVERRNWQKIF